MLKIPFKAESQHLSVVTEHSIPFEIWQVWGPGGGGRLQCSSVQVHLVHSMKKKKNIKGKYTPMSAGSAHLKLRLNDTTPPIEY